MVQASKFAVGFAVRQVAIPGVWRFKWEPFFEELEFELIRILPEIYVVWTGSFHELLMVGSVARRLESLIHPVAKKPSDQQDKHDLYRFHREFYHPFLEDHSLDEPIAKQFKTIQWEDGHGKDVPVDHEIRS